MVVSFCCSTWEVDSLVLSRWSNWFTTHQRCRRFPSVSSCSVLTQFGRELLINLFTWRQAARYTIWSCSSFVSSRHGSHNRASAVTDISQWWCHEGHLVKISLTSRKVPVFTWPVWALNGKEQCTTLKASIMPSYVWLKCSLWRHVVKL